MQTPTGNYAGNVRKNKPSNFINNVKSPNQKSAQKNGSSSSSSSSSSPFAALESLKTKSTDIASDGMRSLDSVLKTMRTRLVAVIRERPVQISIVAVAVGVGVLWSTGYLPRLVQNLSAGFQSIQKSKKI